MSNVKTKKRSGASRPWTCVCGRTVFGNGGQASHKRACRDFRQDKVEKLHQTLNDIEEGTGNWANMSPALAERFKHQFERELERLEESLAL